MQVATIAQNVDSPVDGSNLYHAELHSGEGWGASTISCSRLGTSGCVSPLLARIPISLGEDDWYVFSACRWHQPPQMSASLKVPLWMFRCSQRRAPG